MQWYPQRINRQTEFSALEAESCDRYPQLTTLRRDRMHRRQAVKDL